MVRYFRVTDNYHVGGNISRIKILTRYIRTFKRRRRNPMLYYILLCEESLRKEETLQLRN